MSVRLMMAAGALALVAGSAAQAAPINYTDFSDTSGLTMNGKAAASSGAVSLTSVNSTSTAGAVYANTGITGVDGLNFSTTFTFQVSAQSNLLAGNGFAFVLSDDPTGNGLSNQSMGVSSAQSLDIQFSTFGNRNNNPQIGTSGKYYSNLAAVSTNGNMVVNTGSSGSWGAVYGNAECDNVTGSKSNRSGCMANGDLWTANIAYAKGLLTVTLKDGSQSITTVINNYAVNLASILGNGPIYAGFAASNGAVTEGVSLTSWSFSVPEPMSLGILTAGLGALGMVRRRRAAA